MPDLANMAPAEAIPFWALDAAFIDNTPPLVTDVTIIGTAI